jgi:hypothetical protein
LHERDATDEAITDLYQFHPFMGFMFKPGQVFSGSHPRQVATSRIRIDDHGFISGPDSLALRKADNEIRIAMIGASTTANLSLKLRR